MAPDPRRLIPDATLAVLAGGRSERFGSDKTLAILQGRTLLLRAVERLGPAFAETLVVANRADRFGDVPGARMVADRFPGRGPLAGIHAALEEATHGIVIVATVDAPLVDVPLLAGLADATLVAPAAAFERDGFLHPFPSAFRRSACLETARSLLRDGSPDPARRGRDPRPLDLLRLVRAAMIPLPPADPAGGPDPLADVNTREDLAVIERLLDRRDG